MISQDITYYKDYKIKTYTEKVDGLVVVFKRYDKQGNVVYLWYSDKEWERWKYNDKQCLTKHSDQDGLIIERRFDDTGRMSYEKTRKDGVTYDRSLGNKINDILKHVK